MPRTNTVINPKELLPLMAVFLLLLVTNTALIILLLRSETGLLGTRKSREYTESKVNLRISTRL